MPRKEFQAPLLGVTDATPFIKQPGDATDPDGMRNLVRRNSANGREQLATREKLALEFGGAAFSGKVNGIGTIARSSGVGAVITSDTDAGTTGDSRVSGAFKGQAVVLDTDRSVRAVFADTRGTAALLADPPTVAANAAFGAFQCCWHASDPDIGYFATIAADNVNGDSGGKVVVGVNRFNLATGFITGQIYCMDKNPPYVPGFAGAVDLFSNQILEFAGYLFVCAYRYIYCFRHDTLLYVNRYAIDWTEEVQGIQGVSVAGVDYLLALTTGSTTVRGPVTADATVGPTAERFGEFLGGVLMHQITPLTTATASGAAVLTRKRMPMGIAAGGAGYEDHRYFRISEWAGGRPRGCLPYAFAAVAGTDGSVHAYIARTNQGFGYDGNNAAQQPNGVGPFITACRANLTRAFEASPPASMSFAAPVRYGFSSGVGGWERDTGSLRRPYTWGLNTFQTDIPAISGGLRDPHSVGNEPSLWAVAVDSTNDRVFFAGRRALLVGTAPNVFCYVASTGALLWYADTGHTIQQNGIAVDPTTGNLLVAMRRNNQWTAPDGTIGGAEAEVLELSGETGQTVNAFDLTDAVNHNAYITALNEATVGLGSYGVAVNSRGQVLVAMAPYRYDT